MPEIHDIVLKLFLVYALCSFVYFIKLCSSKRPTSDKTTEPTKEAPFRVHVRLPGPWLGLSGPRLGGEMAIFEQTYFSDLTIGPVKIRRAAALALLGLPRELRDMVYAYVLINPKGLHYDEMSGLLRGGCYFKDVPDLAINSVCRQLRDETLHLALKLNTIWFGNLIGDTGAEGSMERFNLFMTRLSHSQRDQIRHVRLVENLAARNNSLVICTINAADIIEWCYRYQDLQIHVHIAPGYFPYGYGTPAPAGQGLDMLRDWVVRYRKNRWIFGLPLKISIEVPTKADVESFEDDAHNYAITSECYLWFHENRELIEEINGKPWNPWSAEEVGELDSEIWGVERG